MFIRRLLENAVFEGEDEGGGSGSAPDPAPSSAPSSTESGANVQNPDPSTEIPEWQQEGDEGSEGDSIAELRKALEERGIAPALVAKGLLNGAASYSRRVQCSSTPHQAASSTALARAAERASVSASLAEVST